MLLFATPSSQGSTSKPNAKTGATNGQIIRSVPNLQRLVQAHCPALSSTPSPASFKASPVLKTGHLQTLYSAITDTSLIDRVPYQRRVIINPDGGTISLDVTAFPKDGTDAMHAELDDVPTLIVAHGLTGGSSESYIRSVLHVLCSPPSQGGRGYRAVVINSRGCAFTPTSSPQLYSASKTADIRCALLWMTKTFPNSPLLGLGYSLGANFLAKTVGEDGDDTPLVTVIPVGAPWDLLRGSEALEGDGPGGSSLSHVYSTALAGNLNTVISSHASTLALHTPLKPHLSALLRPVKNKTEYYQFCKDHQVPDDGEWTLPAATLEGTHLVTPKTLRHVDDVMTRLVGGHSDPYGEFPLRSAKAYYLQGGAGQVKLLENVRIPLLAINADDDPIVPLPVMAGVFEILGEPAKEAYNRLASKLSLPLHVAAHLVQNSERKKWQQQLSMDTEADTNVIPNENIVLAYTRGGGHLGWWSSVRQRGTRSSRWVTGPIGEWMDMVVARVERAREVALAEADVAKHLGTSGKGQMVSPDEHLERDWALRSFTRSLWNRDAEGAAADDAYSPRIRQRTVSIELVEEDRLPVYDISTGDFVPGSQADAAPKHPIPASPLRSKVPFLLTKVLENAPLIHPKDASIGWHIDRAKRTPVFTGDWQQGRVLDLTMYFDSERPEVGFAELPADSQVAGVGTTFDGGSEVPGQSPEAAAWVKANTKKSWYKSRRKLNSRAGVIRGL
ncbi:hypothetical protein V8E36_008421 [Tilletia maclaganii]